MDKIQEKTGVWRDTYTDIDFFSQPKFPEMSENLSKLRANEEKRWNALLGKSLKLQ